MSWESNDIENSAHETNYYKSKKMNELYRN